jgi:hypothetical protein
MPYQAFQEPETVLIELGYFAVNPCSLGYTKPYPLRKII